MASPIHVLTCSIICTDISLSVIEAAESKVLEADKRRLDPVMNLFMSPACVKRRRHGVGGGINMIKKWGLVVGQL